MTVSIKPKGIHLVGSAPVSSAEEMFRLSMQYLNGYLKRLPDGEVGERDTWIRFQFSRILASEQIEQTDLEPIYVPGSPMKVKDGIVNAADVSFPNLGYADAAIESYGVFERLLIDGTIPDDVRFMVGLPTPLSVAIFYMISGSGELFEQAYGQAIKHELSRMIEAIPAEKLAIQWETVSEFGVLEGLMECHIEGDILNKITDKIAGLVDLVPESVEVGIHLCYGDSGHQHFCQPKDATYLTQVANSVMAKSKRKLAWIHMPVPKERNDIEYFAPLAQLHLSDETDLYLGLVHETGGREATQTRIDAASSVIKKYGIATECGFGRRDIDTIPALMKQQTALCDKI